MSETQTENHEKKPDPTELHNVKAESVVKSVDGVPIRHVINAAQPHVSWERCGQIVNVKPLSLQARMVTGISQEETLQLAKLFEECFPVVVIACELVATWEKASEDERVRLVRMLTAASISFLPPERAARMKAVPT